MNGLAGRLALALASVLLTLLLLEGGLRLLGYTAIHDVYSKPSLFWTADQLLGWRHQPHVSGTFVGPRPWPVEFRTPIRINSQGLRGPEIAELPPGGFRILLLGDSFVAGFEVPWHESFPVLIEEELGRRLDVPVQVINAGVRGYGTDQSLLYFRRDGRALRPDLVVMVHSTNDAEDNVTLHRMRRPFGKPAFALRNDDALELVGHPIGAYPLCSHWGLDDAFAPARFDGVGRRSLCRIETRLADRSALFSFLTHRLRRSPGLLRRLYELASGPAIPDLSAAPAGVASAGLVPASVYAGASARPEPLSAEGRAALLLAIYRELADTVRAEGAGFLTVVADYRTIDAEALQRSGIAVHLFVVRSALLTGSELRFRNDAHLNARGHRLFARNLTPVLVDAISRLRASEGAVPR